MTDRGTTLVIDAAVADAAGIAAQPRVALLPRGRRGAADADAITEAMAQAPLPALVLVRPPWADPAMGPVAAVALLLAHRVVWLPAALAEAGWAAALIATWMDDVPHADLVRRAEVAVGLAALPSCRLPRRPWGGARAAMPALAPQSLGRWCDRLWEACPRCAGGGAPGAPCPRCRHAGVVA